jgi:hypothetical protein
MRRRVCFAVFAGVPILILIALFCLYVAAAAMQGTLNSKWYPWKVHESKRAGDEIIQAIESYRQREGRYPAKLNDLVPRYLRAISPPTAGQKQWTYWAEPNGSAFDLAFQDVRAVPRWYYPSYAHRWYFKSF